VIWKLLGAVMVIGSAGVTGIRVAAGFSRRITELRSLQNALQMLDTEIMYRATPLPVILKKIGQAGEGSIAKIFKAAGDALNQEQGFTPAEAWNKALLENWQLTALSQDDYTILASFGEMLGLSDREEQHKNIALTSLHLGREEEKAQLEREKNERLWRYGGFLIGISIVLLLL
jgi:stage III sporulation protein AB